MGIYTRRILPWLIDRGMRNKALAKYRPRVPAHASGRVLEVGIGAGLNFSHYGPDVEHLFGLEPSDALRATAAGAAEGLPFPVTLIGSGAEAIPLDDHSIDTIVSTWTMCSIPQLEPALQEMRRVLKPDGRLLFMEHGRAPDTEVARLQDRLTPVFLCLAGCNPGRPMGQLITDAGFRFHEIQMDYLEGPRFIAYHYIGDARPR
ncbi:MAG: class I SAM-dependent methyltransferase [Gammaproteobacteria bacterium]|nr:class I SAM-dependent methyltransferase [Gammaproteobacteria bacterium]